MAFPDIAFADAWPLIFLVVLGWLILRRVFGSKSSSDSPRLFNGACESAHDARRFATYPPPVPNTWYHLVDSDEVCCDDTKVLYVRALGQNFAVWRTRDGTPIVFDAFCPHGGANLGVGGTKTRDDCVKCPFHEWTFDRDGRLVDVPYLRDAQKVSKVREHCAPIRKWLAKDWCGLLCVYFHADADELRDGEAQFELPNFIARELSSASWHLHARRDIGRVALSCVDWVDQSHDHGHFHTLHSHFMVPYTQCALPNWLNAYVGIAHECTTIVGGKWIEALHGAKDAYYGDCAEPFYLYFLDRAGVTWKGAVMEASKSLTKEFYVGPAIMIFHIPLQSMGLGSVKIFVTTTPTLRDDGHSAGSVMRMRVWLSDDSWRLRVAAWLIVGIATSQLLSDIEIMCNKIRRRKPCITKQCGPYAVVNAWLKKFYSKSSANVGKASLDW